MANNLLFSFTTRTTSSFHHHDCLCIGGPLVLPHAASAPSTMHFLSSFHKHSTLPLALSLKPKLVHTLSWNSLKTSISFNLQTLHLLTNTCFFFFMHYELTNHQ